MKAQPFEANVREMDNMAIIDLSGEINAFADAAMSQAYDQVESLEPATVVLNFQNVSYINSTGIALIVGLLARARKSHTSMAVYGLSDHYVEIFEITRLVDFMDIFPDEASALHKTTA